MMNAAAVETLGDLEQTAKFFSIALEQIQPSPGFG